MAVENNACQAFLLIYKVVSLFFQSLRSVQSLLMTAQGH